MHRLLQIIRCHIFVAMCVGANTIVLADDTIRIGWVYAMANTPLLVAYHNGHFTQAGVNVQIRRFNSGPLLKRALEAGDMDMAYIGMPPVYHAIAQGAELKIVAKVNYGQAALITHKDSSIKTLADLKNKKIAGVRRGSGMDVLLKAFVLKEAAQLDADKDVSILYMPTKMMAASVNKKVVDAAFTWEPFVSMAVLTEGAHVLLDMNKAVPRYPWYVLVANKKILTTKRNDLYKILKAHRRAVGYLNAHPEAGNDLIIDMFHIRNALQAVGSKVQAKDIILEARGRLGWDEKFELQDEKFLQRLMDYSFSLGFLKKKLQVNDIIDRDAINWLQKQFN